MNKQNINKQSYFIDKNNASDIPLEGGGVLIEDTHLTKVF
ncbi:hypothetical protein M998_3200 [Providencia heimbachae ATCC 35613]|uniref:Uncharacterized protein n=1 Tax=Providencia heimbachae ATCC 35613 TaxID=1354272 RepID=A0A1B7JLS7_9GAMM|nr:hypothetical protein M998_3200 [Providencia heimbachae ATCC 35613]